MTDTVTDRLSEIEARMRGMGEGSGYGYHGVERTPWWTLDIPWLVERVRALEHTVTLREEENASQAAITLEMRANYNGLHDHYRHRLAALDEGLRARNSMVETMKAQIAELRSQVAEYRTRAMRAEDSLHRLCPEEALAAEARRVDEQEERIRAIAAERDELQARLHETVLDLQERDDTLRFFAGEEWHHRVDCWTGGRGCQCSLQPWTGDAARE